MLKNKFPFAKPTSENNNLGGNASSPWGQMYNKNNPTNANNFGGGGFNQPNTNQNWGNNQAGFGNNVGGGWPQTNNNNNTWGGGGNKWNNKAGWNGQAPQTGGMGGIMGAGSNPTAVIASGQKLVGKQKQTLGQMNNFYANVIVKNQQLDTLKLSLEAEEQWLRR